jgi:hypothetical protein
VRSVGTRLEDGQHDAAVTVEELGCPVVRNDANVFGHGVLLSPEWTVATRFAIAVDGGSWEGAVASERVRMARTFGSSPRRVSTLTRSPACSSVSGCG